jgi:thiosulfate/3-mercaptopyruvate sulfurtransferase
MIAFEGGLHMNTLKSVIAAAALTVSAVAQAATLTPVINAFTLTDLQEQGAVKVLEIRSDPDAFAKAHIPGAIHIPYGEFRGPKGNPGALPELKALAKTLGSRGFTPEDTVVVVHDGVTTSDFGAAARVYWTLKSVGFTELAILNGGFRAYQKDGFEVSSTATQVQPVEVALSFNPAWYADTDSVAARLDAGEGASLIDARLDALKHGMVRRQNLESCLGQRTFRLKPSSTKTPRFSKTKQRSKALWLPKAWISPVRCPIAIPDIGQRPIGLC